MNVQGSRLYETFKIMNGLINSDLFFQLDEVVEEVMTRNCSRKDSDSILVNTLLVTEILITVTRYLQIVFIVKLLILLRNISRLHWNRELYSFETLR